MGLWAKPEQSEPLRTRKKYPGNKSSVFEVEVSKIFEPVVCAAAHSSRCSGSRGALLPGGPELWDPGQVTSPLRLSFPHL